MDPRTAAFRHLMDQCDNALQNSGLLIAGGGDARANWKALAAELTQQFFIDVNETGVAPTLTSRPPRRRINDNGIARWSDPPAPITDVERLFIAGVNQVRNNISHGNKLEMDGRDVLLISEAHSVLEMAVKRSPRLRHLVFAN